MTGKYHSECIARAKYRALEAEVQRLTDELAGEDDRIKAAASIAYQEGSESGLIDRQILITTLAERDATIARLTAERADAYDEGWLSGENAWANTNPYRDALDAEGQEPAAETHPFAVDKRRYSRIDACERCSRGRNDTIHRAAAEPVLE